jgi:iron complex transport system permease protein
MGLGDHVVGVTRFCQLPQGIERPRLGDAQTINAELILRVRPDLIFTQSDLRYFNGVTDLDPHVRVVRIRIESLLGIHQAMKTIVSEAVQAGLERPRILFVMGTDRPVAFGDKSFLGDLIELLGGGNAGADIPGRGAYRRTDIDRILAVQPDVLICQVSPGQEQLARQYWNQWRDLPPVATGKVHVVSDPNWTMPSTRLLPLGAQLARMIHAPGHVQVVAGRGTLDASHARLLRLLAAALVGAALAAAGMALQGLLRNPLAEPFVLGISSGAGVGVLLGLALAGPWVVPAWATTPVLAFAGAILTCLAVYAIAQRRGQLNPYSLILAGVIINSFNAAIMLTITLYVDPDRIADFSHWAMGRFPDSVDLSLLLVCSACIAAGWLLLLLHAASFNVLSLGDEVANSSGVRVHRLQLVTFAAVGLMTAAAVALAGPIAFLGLIVPHICRMIIGPDHRQLVVVSGLAGAVFLVAAEWLCRTVGPLINVSLIPVGIITALAGGPFFIVLLRRRFQENLE